jgi:hypothetical protein
MDDVVAAAVPDKVPQDAEPEDERRPDPAPPVDVELQPRADGHDANAANARILALIPLPQRQIGNVMTRGGEPFREVPIPPLRAADGVRVKAVVDDADAHADERIGSIPPPPGSGMGPDRSPSSPVKGRLIHREGGHAAHARSRTVPA